MSANPATMVPTHCASPSGTAWNPGVESRIPRDFRALETICRPDCVLSSVAWLDELTDLTGLPPEELTVFRPARLALHELIIRITADIAVAEGDSEEQFGQNFRRIAQCLLDTHLAPHMGRIENAHAHLRQDADRVVRAILAERLAPPTPTRPRSLRDRLFGRARRREAPTEAPEEREHRVIADLKASGLSASDRLERAAFKSLYRILGAIAAQRGYIGTDLDLLATLAVNHVCNTLGSELVGREIAPLIDTAIDAEGYTRVRNRANPVLISLKGASAAGKSSIRPMVKRLMRDTGIEGDGYATISPDVWRRLLLDYEALGPATLYAGHLTSREVMVIDAKLDRYISEKASQQQAIPHLLVDRFRFDSFSTKELGRVLHDTYTRYVSTLHMYFLVTPPEETVERGWLRALERGRYKAVEDFLGHCVEAYGGMPRVLFKWLAYPHIDYRYYFLDNRVPKGTFPAPIAVGDRQHMTIFDPAGLVAIRRYEHIDIHARDRGELYPPDRPMNMARDASFLLECLRRIPHVTFVAGPNATPYLEFHAGRGVLLDPQRFSELMIDPSLAVILREVARHTALPLPPI